jgi:hypothetical protein
MPTEEYTNSIVHSTLDIPTDNLRFSKIPEDKRMISNWSRN